MEENLKLINPRSNTIELTIPISKILTALQNLYLLTFEPDLDIAITIGFQLAKDVRTRQMISLIDTVYQFTLDKLIEPESFNIVEEYKKISERGFS